jgi:DNA-binding transcriptional LysR family regulator
MEQLSALEDLDLVRTFLVVAEEGNLTRASVRLFRTQPAISRRLQSLEQSLGATLFQRGKSGVGLTEAGSRLVAPARALLHAQERLVQSVRGDRGEVVGTEARLRIACSDTVARYLLAPRLSAVTKRYPGLALELQVSNTPQTIARVSDGEADLGFVLLPARHKGLEFQPVLKYRHMAAFPAGTAPRGKEVPLSYLMERPLVLLDRSTRTRQLIDASLLTKGLFPGRVTEVGNVSVQKALVRAGLGVGILPGYAKEASDGLGWRSIAGSSERVLAGCLRKEVARTPVVENLLGELAV